VTKAERIRQEAIDLWIATFGEPPDESIEPSKLLDILLNRTEPQSYTRLNVVARARDITFPR